MLSNFAALRLRQTIQPQAVLLKIDLGKQPPLEFLHLHEIHFAFEYRFLYALPRRLAHFGHAPQSSAACACFGIDVIADDYEHGMPYLIVNGK